MGIKSIFSKNSKNTDREIWVNTLSKIIDPVLTNVANSLGTTAVTNDTVTISGTTLNKVDSTVLYKFADIDMLAGRAYKQPSFHSRFNTLKSFSTVSFPISFSELTATS